MYFLAGYPVCFTEYWISGRIIPIVDNMPFYDMNCMVVMNAMPNRKMNEGNVVTNNRFGPGGGVIAARFPLYPPLSCHLLFPNPQDATAG